MGDEEFLGRLIASLEAPRVHDIQAVIRKVPQAYERASMYGFEPVKAGNLDNFRKKSPDYSAEVFQNGTIRIIISASSKGGLDAYEFNDLLFTIGVDIFPLVMRPLSLKDFEIEELHLNVDKELFGYMPKFKVITVKSLTGGLLRAYEKKVGGVKKLRVEACGRPEDASLLLERMFMGTASSVDREREYRDFIYLMMREYREIRDSIDLKLGSMTTIAASMEPMHGPNGAEPGKNNTAPTISSSPPKPLFSPNASRGDTAAPGAPRMGASSFEPLPPPEPCQDQRAPQSSGRCPRLKPGAYPYHAWCGIDFQVWNGAPAIDPFPCCSQGPGGYESCGFYQNLKKDGLLK